MGIPVGDILDRALRAASGGLIGRRVQTLVVFVVLVASSAAGILGLTLLTHANELFLNTVSDQRVADAAVFVNSGRRLPDRGSVRRLAPRAHHRHQPGDHHYRPQIALTWPEPRS